MRIAILHLSDFHFRSYERVYSEKIEKLVDSLESASAFDECIVIFSGDMTFHGTKEEFAPAKFTLGGIVAKIRNRYKTPFIPLLCIPGNHDLQQNESSRKHADIRSYYDNGTVDQQLECEFAAMNDYFSETFTTNSNWSNKLISRRLQRYGNFNIQINLVNTAPFSTLRPDDKECHYFPNEQMHFLHKHDDATICITVMHHGLEWFDWSCKSNLEKTIYDNSEFLFTGHDHIGSGRTVSFSNDSGVWVSAAGSMAFAQYTHEDSFNLLVVDTDENNFSGFQYTWSPTDRLFYHKTLISGKSISRKSQRIQPRSSYIKEIKADTRHKLSSEFVDYFVFPKLSCNNSRDYKAGKNLPDFESFYDYMKSHQLLFIDGESNSGKSTLLRYLYVRLAERGAPLLWDASQVRVSPKNLIKSLFSSQYGDNPASLERYNQMPKNCRYLIIDNWDVVNERDQNKLLSQLQPLFGYVILGRNIAFGENDIDVEERVKEALVAEDESNILRIEPFFRGKRRELVRNICVVSGTLNEEDIEHVNNAINTLVQNHASMFILNPEFIIQYTVYFSKESNHSYQRGERIFCTIFDYNIKHLLIGSTSTQNVDEYLTVLEEIAHVMHSKRRDHLSTSDIDNVIKTYNSEYAADVKTRKFFDTMFNAKIFRYIGSSFDVAFANRNYLSYFVARYICRDIMNNDNYSDINECAKYICYGINADVLLFITYLTSNIRIIKTISNLAGELMSDWNTLGIGSDGISLLNQVSINTANSVNEPTKADHEKAETIGEYQEERIHENVDISTHGVYDYDMERYDSLAFKLQRAFAYTELLAKALPAFSNILKAEQKNKLAESIFVYPSKIANTAIAPIARNIDTLTQQMLRMADQMYIDGEISNKPTEETIKNILRNLALGIILGLLNHFAECAVDAKTSNLLAKRETRNAIDSIVRLLVRSRRAGAQSAIHSRNHHR